jgi:leucine-rich repeat protein SHOC2
MEQEELEQIIEQARLDRCTKLDLCTMLEMTELNQTNLPESVGNLSRLTELDLGDCNIVSIPESIGNLSNLTKLNLGSCDPFSPQQYNKLTSLPESIGGLSNLASLSLYNNLLTGLPDSIGNLHSLTELDLSNNRLAILPESISNLSSLVNLDLSSSQLNIFPESIENISRITINLMSGENIKIQAKNISFFPSLTELNISNNQFTTIPQSFYNLSKLSYLNLTNNPVTDLSILQKLSSLRNVDFLGVRLPRRYWIELSEWKYEWLFDEDNIEIRRILIEQLGYQNITEELNSLIIDTWREYILLKVEKVNQVYNEVTQTIDIEPMVLLKMTCPSTQHIHVLRVPPEIESAEAAITWVNHGIHPDEFAVQT